MSTRSSAQRNRPQNKGAVPNRRFFTTATGHAASTIAARHAAEARRTYQCVFCRTGFFGVMDLMAHEATCDARDVVQRQWEQAITRAKRREEAGSA